MALLRQPPLVVGTIRPEGLTALAALPRIKRLPDIIEARLDLAVTEAHPTVLPDLRAFLATCQRLQETGSPVLCTIRLVPDGGRWTEDSQRMPWFEQAVAVAAWVDIEVGSAIAADVVGLAHARGRQVVVSHHDFARTPTAEGLEAIVDRCRTLGADIVKVATLVESLEDHHRLIDLVRARRDDALAVIGMGPVGTPLRSYLPSIGSRLTYGYLDQVAAPGQIHAGDLVQRLVNDCPAYAAHRRQKAQS
jgi:3-dehydroquinate dehydratase-1